MTQADQNTATKKKVLIDCRVVADLSFCIRWIHDVEKQAKALEARARDFNEFIRDHRSQDDIRLEVERIYEDQCSNCGSPWEVLPAADGEPECCAHCGAPTKAPESKETP